VPASRSVAHGCRAAVLQTIAGASGSSVRRSQTTNVSRWLVMPTARTFAGVASAARSASCAEAWTADQISSASCLHPRGLRIVLRDLVIALGADHAVESDDHGRRSVVAFVQAQHDAALSHQSRSSAFGVLPGPVQTAGRVAFEIGPTRTVARFAHRVETRSRCVTSRPRFPRHHLDSRHVTVMPDAHLRKAERLHRRLGRPSILRSASTVTCVPCGMRDERHANDGLFQLGQAELPGARRGSRLPCGFEQWETHAAPDREPWPGRWVVRIIGCGAVGEVIESQLSLHGSSCRRAPLCSESIRSGLLRA